MKVVIFGLLFILISCGKINNSQQSDQTQDQQQDLMQISQSCNCNDQEELLCGNDNITYYNQCYLNCFNKSVSKQGACTYNNSTFCTTLYDPVCGFNGITYSNSCVAGLEDVNSYSKGSCR